MRLLVWPVRDPWHTRHTLGFIAVLHTWGQTLQYHPHVHCLIPGGGLSLDGQRWISCRQGFFLPVRVLSRFFRTCFLTLLQEAFDKRRLQFFSTLTPLAHADQFAAYLAPVHTAEWIVYAKPPFGGPEQVLNYLSRYAHRVAIANHRLVTIDDGQVSFHWRDYHHHQQRKRMTLSADEFIRRVLLHVVPQGAHRIRHYGFLSKRWRVAKVAQCRQLCGSVSAMAVAPPLSKDYRLVYAHLTRHSLLRCPVCQQGVMHWIEVLAPTPVRQCLVRRDSS